MSPISWFWRRYLGVADRGHAAVTAATLAIVSLNVALVSYFLVSRAGSLSFLRLHYTAGTGVDWIAPWWQIALFPAAGVAFFLINGGLSGLLARRHRGFGSTIMFVTGAVETVLAGAALTAVLLNS